MHSDLSLFYTSPQCFSVKGSDQGKWLFPSDSQIIRGYEKMVKVSLFDIHWRIILRRRINIHRKQNTRKDKKTHKKASQKKSRKSSACINFLREAMACIHQVMLRTEVEYEVSNFVCCGWKSLSSITLQLWSKATIPSFMSILGSWYYKILFFSDVMSCSSLLYIIYSYS